MGYVWLGQPKSGQALVETALALPVILLLAFGVIAAGRLTKAQMDVSAVAREAARSASLARSAGDARSQGSVRALEAARGYGLDGRRLVVSVDASGFKPGGWVRTTVGYNVSFHDLPLLGWSSYTVRSSHAERVDPYRSMETPGGSQ